MHTIKKKPRPKKNTRNAKFPVPAGGTHQLRLFSNDVAQPSNELPIAFVVHGTEFRLKPAPTNPQAALIRVMNVMIQLHQQRDSWVPQMQTLKHPVSLFLENDVECFVCLWDSDQNDFVGVRNLNGKLHFHFPHPDRWIAIGLGNTICRDAYLG